MFVNYYILQSLIQQVTPVNPETVAGSIVLPLWLVVSAFIGLLSLVATGFGLAWSERSKRHENDMANLLKYHELNTSSNATLDKVITTVGSVASGMERMERAISVLERKG